MSNLRKKLYKQANENIKNKLLENAKAYCSYNDIDQSTISLTDTTNGANVIFGNLRKYGFIISVSVCNDNFGDEIIVTVPGNFSKTITDQSAFDSFLTCANEGGRVFDEYIEDALEELGEQQNK